MAQPYVGEIRLFAGNFAPAGWQFCDGRLLPISTNEVLFQLIGTTYGGDGQSTFALPDLRGRVPVHLGTGSGLSGRILGEIGGTESVTLAVQQTPTHNHPLLGTTGNGAQVNPVGAILASSTVVSLYAAEAANAAMAPSAIVPAGGSQPHTNMQPFLCITYIISLFGLYPSPT